MSTGKISLDGAAWKKQKNTNTSNPMDYAKQHSERVAEETKEHNKLSNDNDYYASIFRAVNSGNYTKDRLESLMNLKAGSYNTGSSANGILFAQQQSYIKNIREKAEEQANKLKNFDNSVRFEDINLNGVNSNAATKEDYDFAQAVYKELLDSGDEAVSFNDVLAEVQGGKYNNI